MKISVCNTDGMDMSNLPDTPVMRFCNQGATLTGEILFNPAHIDKTLAGHGMNQEIMFNIEPAWNSPREWFYHEYFGQWGDKQRSSLANHLVQNYPDLAWTFYRTIGITSKGDTGTEEHDKWWWQRKNLEREQSAARSYSEELAPIVCLSAYWAYEATDAPSWRFSAWRRQVGYAIETGRYVHRREPTVVLSPTVSGHGDQFVDQAIWEYMLEYCAHQGVDVIVWDQKSTTDYPWYVLQSIYGYGS